MYLFGASGHAKVILDILRLRGQVVRGLLDDDPAKKELLGIPVLGNTEAWQEEWFPCLISIGNNHLRRKVAGKVNAVYATAIHPDAVVAEPSSIGSGTVIMAGAVINPDTRIGRHVIINTRASVDHDNQIGDFVHIAPGSTLCGGITVGEGTLIGSGATILPNITIGKWVTIGGGAVVTQDIPDHSTAVGCPARIIRTR